MLYKFSDLGSQLSYIEHLILIQKQSKYMQKCNPDSISLFKLQVLILLVGHETAVAVALVFVYVSESHR